MPASMRITLTPVSVSPARIAAGMGVGPRQRGSSEGCRFRQPNGRQIEHRRAQDLAIGDHRDARPAPRAQAGQYVGVAQSRRLPDREAQRRRRDLDRRRLQRAPPAARCDPLRHTCRS